MNRNLSSGVLQEACCGQWSGLEPHSHDIRLSHKVLGGFAGAAADALTLFEKFEQKLEQYEGDLKRATVELAKDWRLDKMLRHLDAMLVVMDKKNMVGGLTEYDITKLIIEKLNKELPSLNLK